MITQIEKERLISTINHIIAQPETCDQEIWQTECGTARCFIGWLVHLHGDSNRSFGWLREAARLLPSINPDEIDNIADVDNTFTEVYAWVCEQCEIQTPLLPTIGNPKDFFPLSL